MTDCARLCSHYREYCALFMYLHTHVQQRNLDSASMSRQKATFPPSFSRLLQLWNIQRFNRTLAAGSAGSTDHSKLRRVRQQFHWNVIVRALCPPQSDMRDLSPGPLGLTAKHNDMHTHTHTDTHTHTIKSRWISFQRLQLRIIGRARAK